MILSFAYLASSALLRLLMGTNSRFTTLDSAQISDTPGRWLLGMSREYDRDRLRALRLHLFRLHSEREALRIVMLLSLG
jgi:hypothetical protein